MEAAEAAAQQIFEIAARQTPPWACEIVEREDGKKHARVAVKAELKGEVLTLVAQVGQKKGLLKFFRNEGLKKLANIDTGKFPYDAESLEECWDEG